MMPILCGIIRVRRFFQLPGMWFRGFSLQPGSAGAWKANGVLYRMTKWWEDRFFKAADAVVVLSNKRG